MTVRKSARELLIAAKEARRDGERMFAYALLADARKLAPRKRRIVLTCAHCGHRGERDTVRSRCPACGRPASASDT